MSAGGRRARFRELHARAQLSVMPNPWDVGSARLLASCGFEALATTSSGYAWSLGKLDQTVTHDELVAHVREVAAATPLPLDVDSERCYPDDPGGVPETVALLAHAGAAGFSVEDYNPATSGIDDVGVAAARVALAARSSARAGLAVVCFANRQHVAGTRRVHQREHARSRAGTAVGPLTTELQDKRGRQRPGVYASTAPEPPW